MNADDEILSYDQFLALYHKAQVAKVIASGHLKPKGQSISASTNPVPPPVSVAPIAICINRFGPYGLWDSENNRPVFGWAPILFGWLVIIRENAESTDPEVALNGVPWSRGDGLVPWGESRWSNGPAAA